MSTKPKKTVKSTRGTIKLRFLQHVDVYIRADCDHLDDRSQDINERYPRSKILQYHDGKKWVNVPMVAKETKRHQSCI